MLRNHFTNDSKWLFKWALKICNRNEKNPKTIWKNEKKTTHEKKAKMKHNVIFNHMYGKWTHQNTVISTDKEEKRKKKRKVKKWNKNEIKMRSSSL